jgi:hypothetical protein
MKGVAWLIPLLAVSAITSACVDGAVRDGGTVSQASDAIPVCHGYGCKYRTRVVLGAPDIERLGAILAGGATSPGDERAAIGRAVAYFDRRAFDTIGIRDEPRSKLGAGGVRGQLDCIDESTNTRSLLLFLRGRHLLRHHDVGRNISRGLLVDGRYFHSTAVISEPGGKEWAVDSWYSATGGEPDIIPLDQWEAEDSEIRDARQR